MQKKMLIDATHPEETRVVVQDGKRLEEFDYEAAGGWLAGHDAVSRILAVVGAVVSLILLRGAAPSPRFTACATSPARW